MKKLLYILVLFISFSSFGQNNKDALRLCSVLQSNSFSSNSAAEDALERILGTIGASKRFVLQPCSNTNNAVATSYRGIRYILYDPDFMNTLNYGNNWGNLFILAHEVGHHINGHSLDLVLYAADAVESVSLAQSRQQELEADEFAGFVLARLGGPISDANEVISKISNNSDDSYSTHPSRSKRLAAVSRGYNKIQNNKVVKKSKKQIAEEYFYSAIKKYKISDYYGAIADFNKVLEIDPNDYYAYINRGSSKAELGNYKKAIADFNRALEIDPDDASAFFKRGRCKYSLYDYYGAIADFTKAIVIDPNIAFTTSNPYYHRGYAKNNIGDANGAIADFNKALEIDPDDANTLYMRGRNKNHLKDYEGALNDLNKTIEIKSNFSVAYFERGISKNGIEDSYGSIADFTKAIVIDPNYTDAYVNRGLMKFYIGDKYNGCKDLRKAESLGYDISALEKDCN